VRFWFFPDLLERGMAFPFTTLAAVSSSTGSADAGSVPVLNGNGQLDMSFMQGANASSGSALAGLLPFLNASGVLDPSFYKGVTTGGTSTQAGDTPILNSSGQLDPSFLTSVVSGGGSGSTLTIGGWMIQIGTGTIPASNSHTASTNVTFPTQMASCNAVIIIPSNGLLTSQGYNAIPMVPSKSGTQFTVEVDINAPGNIPPITNAINFVYVAFGTPT
jgi:hypothetical protein